MSIVHLIQQHCIQSVKTLYGADIAVRPEWRRHGVSRLLYEKRVVLMKRYNLRRMVAYGRIPGYTEHAGMQDVERFMKHYFLIAKDVGDLTAILRADLEDSHAKSVPVLSRLMARLRPVKRRKLAESDDFIVDKNRITIAADNVFSRDPVNLIRICHLAQKHNLAFHPDAMRAITRSLKLIDAKLRENEEANRLFGTLAQEPN